MGALLVVLMLATGCSQAEEREVTPLQELTGIDTMKTNGLDLPVWTDFEKKMNKNPISVINPASVEYAGGEEAFLAEAFPKGTKVEVFGDSWVAEGYGGMVRLKITQPGSEPVWHVAFLLLDDKGRWWVINTVAAREPKDPNSKVTVAKSGAE